MPTTIGRGVVEVVYDKDQAEKSARDAIMPGLGRIAGDMAGLFAGKKIFDFAKQGFGELMEAEKVAALTASTIKATGSAAGVTSEQVADLAGSLSDMSGKDDELIQSGANLILTFKNIKNEVGDGNDVFDQATEAALNLSTAGFGSMESASVMLGKALNDPIAGVSALGRAGVTFSEDQKAMIRSLAETGDLLGAQKIILAEVEAQVGGAAEAYGDTLAGKMERAQTAMDNAKGAMVSGLAPALEFGAEAAVKLGDAFQAQPEILQQVEGGLLLVGGGIAAVARPINDVISLVKTMRGAQQAASAATDVAAAANVGLAASTAAVATAEGTEAVAATTAATATTAFAASEGAATVAGAGLATTIGLIVAPLVLAAAAWYGLSNQTSLSVDAMEAAKTPTDDLIRGLEKLGGIDSSTGLKAFQQIAEGSIGTAQRLRDQYAAQGQDVSKLDEIIAGVSGSQRQLNADQEAASGIVDDAATATQEFAVDTDTLKSAQDALLGTVDKIGAAFDKAYGRAIDPAKLAADLAAKTDALTAALETNGVTLDINTEAGRKNQDAVLAAGDAVVNLIQKRFEESGSIERAQAAGLEYVQGLRDQMAQAGYSQQAIDLMIQTMHLTPEEIATTFSNNAYEVKPSVDALKAQIDLVPEEKRTAFLAHVDAGEYEYAQMLLDEAAHDRYVKFIAVQETAGLYASAGREAPGRAAGGSVGPNQMFIGGEAGWEILFHGLHQAPTSGGFVMPHDQSERFLSGQLAGSAGGSGNTYQLTSGDVNVQEAEDITTAFRRLELLAGV